MDRKILLQNLADSVAERTGITKRKAEAFVRSFFEVTEEGLLADGIVKVKGFGTTKIVAVSGRESVNINTGERFQIEGHDKVTFTPDALFRDLVNRPFAHFATTILADNLEETELAVTGQLPQEEDKTIVEEEPVVEVEPVVEEEPVEETPLTPEEEIEEVIETENSTAGIESAAQTENQSDNSHNKEKEEDMQHPIIIQNTIPESRHNWWRVGFVILATLVLMTLSYFVGYFHLLCPCEWETPSQPEKTIAQTDVAPKTTVATPKKSNAKQSEVKKSDAEKLAAQKEAEAKKAEEQAAGEKKAAIAYEEKRLREEAKKYRQMDGEYLITGVLETHEMKVGDNLYKLARQAYGDKKLATYIIFHNQINNPDLVKLGQKIEIPQLTKKE